MRRLGAELLRRIRNDIAVATVLERLEIPRQVRGRRLIFRCPDCLESEAVPSLRHNLARCFRCNRSFNAIELVMAERHSSFLQAVDYLQALLSE